MSDNKKVLDEIGTQFNIDKVKSELKDRPKVWEGRQEVWESLPDSKKEKWDYANFTDDSAIAVVTDDCEPDNPNAISSQGVYNHALVRVTELPSEPTDGDTVLYMGQNIYTYNAVTPQGTENPQNEGWYEQNGMDYVLTEDTSITAGKTYYERVRGLVSGGIYEYENGEWVLKSVETTPQITLDDTLDENSNNAVKNSAITAEVNKRLVVTDTMPTASADLLGQTRLYIGSTTTNYQEGGIYKCESDGQTPPTYDWNIKNKADIDISDKQDKTLETPLTIGGASRTTVEGALGGLNGLVPSDAGASNKLMTRRCIRYNNASDLENAIVNLPDHSQLDFAVTSAITIGGATLPQYTAWHIYRDSKGLACIGGVGYSYLDGSCYKIQGSINSPKVAGLSLTMQKLVTESDLTSSVISGSTAPITAGGIYSTFQGQYATMNTSIPNYQSGFCKYVSIGAFIVGSGRIHVSEDTQSAEIVSGLPSNSAIIPVLIYSSTHDADLGYARYEAGSIVVNLLKAGHSRFSFCGLLINE